MTCCSTWRRASLPRFGRVVREGLRRVRPEAAAVRCRMEQIAGAGCDARHDHDRNCPEGQQDQQCGRRGSRHRGDQQRDSCAGARIGREAGKQARSPDDRVECAVAFACDQRCRRRDGDHDEGNADSDAADRDELAGKDAAVACARGHDLAQRAALALACEGAMAHDEDQQRQQARQNARDAEIRQPTELGRILCRPEHRRILPMRFEPDHLAEIRRGAGIEHRQRCRRLVRHAAEVRGRMRRLASLLQERRTIVRLRLVAPAVRA